MPQTKQAYKALRQDIKKAHRNKLILSEIKTLEKKTRKAIDAKDAKAEELLKTAVKKIDKASQKGQLKKNTASRKKSRLMRAYNKSKAEKK